MNELGSTREWRCITSTTYRSICEQEQQGTQPFPRTLQPVSRGVGHAGRQSREISGADIIE